MKTYKKTFDFYATDIELDTYVYDILSGPDYDLELHLQDDCQFIRIEVWDRVLH